MHSGSSGVARRKKVRRLVFGVSAFGGGKTTRSRAILNRAFQAFELLSHEIEDEERRRERGRFRNERRGITSAVDAMVFVRLPDMRQPDIMKTYIIKAVGTANRLWSGARPCRPLGEEPVGRLGVLAPPGPDAYLASCAVRTRHAPIGGCLVQPEPDNRAPGGDVTRSDPSDWQLNSVKDGNFVALKNDEKQLARFPVT